uniref:Salivary lipocalin n=2 Tax=Triatominae TaxID=70999 RepID=G3CJR7_DIPMA
MKTFITLTFIGILTNAYAGSISECKQPTPVVDGFKATEFHTGTWYVTHVANKTEPTDCRTLSTSTRNPGTNDKTYIVEHPYEVGNEKKLHCEAKPEAQKRLTFACKTDGKDTDSTIFIAMATDYKDYALYYLCTTVLSGSDKGQKYDNFLVARRSPSNEIPGKLQDLTKNLNLQRCS